MRVRRNLAEAAFEIPINEIADQCRSIYPDELLNAAVVKMNHSRVRQLAVIERGDENGFRIPAITLTSCRVRNHYCRLSIDAEALCG
jgi:hypothetical protein